MARLTIEDCLETVNNRYDLLILATKRARQIAFGADPMVEEDNDKPTVIALREIAAGLVTLDNIDEIGRPAPLDEFEDSEEDVNFPVPE
ncbi:MAG TPA: DNA-directed RNA polymerase subunit omega [Gammaproteobacteria bacterium]|nr:DNA-directed RNA polymerase subunit omega [Gammaproteobacteria bacterium]